MEAQYGDDDSSERDRFYREDDGKRRSERQSRRLKQREGEEAEHGYCRRSEQCSNRAVAQLFRDILGLIHMLTQVYYRYSEKKYTA